MVLLIFSGAFPGLLRLQKPGGGLSAVPRISAPFLRRASFALLSQLSFGTRRLAATIPKLT